MVVFGILFFCCFSALFCAACKFISSYILTKLFGRPTKDQASIWDVCVRTVISDYSLDYLYSIQVPTSDWHLKSEPAEADVFEFRRTEKKKEGAETGKLSLLKISMADIFFPSSSFILPRWSTCLSSSSLLVHMQPSELSRGEERGKCQNFNWKKNLRLHGRVRFLKLFAVKLLPLSRDQRQLESNLPIKANNETKVSFIP